MAKENTNYTLAFLQQFYRDAYTAIRSHMGPEKKVVFCDAFEREIWDDFLKEFDGVVLDTHNYLMTPDMTIFKEKNVEVYKSYLQELGEKVNATARRIPLIVGEWNAQNHADGLEQMSKEEIAHLYTTVADEFQKGMADCLGWFYWSYKVHGCGLDAICDDAGRMRNHGWLRF